MKRTYKYFLLLIAVFMSSPTIMLAQENDLQQLGFEDPIVTKGGESSIVSHAESAVIIPGETHDALWVHPELMTIPGDPIIIEMRARTTDRRGGDRHRAWHYFQTKDYFNTLQPIDQPTDSIWERKDLSLCDLALSETSVKMPSQLGHTWGSAFVYLNPKTILQAFTTRDGSRNSVQSLIAEYKNGNLVPKHISNSFTINTGRGLYEPHIASYKDNYYMTARAEDGRGYIMKSEDMGRTWSKPKPWTWENGDTIPMNQTMTKLLSHSDGLTLVYTRIRKDNDNVFRNRAPLHIADVDHKTLSLKRSTERIIVPNRSEKESGLPVGNFWVWPINQKESYVIVAEWPRDGRQENGDIWLVKIHWRHPNQKMTSNGREKVTLK